MMKHTTIVSLRQYTDLSQTVVDAVHGMPWINNINDSDNNPIHLLCMLSNHQPLSKMSGTDEFSAVLGGAGAQRLILFQLNTILYSTMRK